MNSCSPRKTKNQKSLTPSLSLKKTSIFVSPKNNLITTWTTEFMTLMRVQTTPISFKSMQMFWVLIWIKKVSRRLLTSRKKSIHSNNQAKQTLSNFKETVHHLLWLFRKNLLSLKRPFSSRMHPKLRYIRMFTSHHKKSCCLNCPL